MSILVSLLCSNYHFITHCRSSIGCTFCPRSLVSKGNTVRLSLSVVYDSLRLIQEIAFTNCADCQRADVGHTGYGLTTV
jgi:hypothetical protein